ncbi:MAG: hypothetical protein ACK5MK_00965 [Dysgonomonas sp.]
MNNYPDNTDKQGTCLWAYPLFLIISIAFIALYSTSTSPLYVGYGGDSANYLMMGKMLLHGMIPYLDFFDHKGPLVMFIEAFGQMIVPDRNGVFILQIINLTLVLSLTFKTARLILNKINSFIVVVVTLFFFAFTIEGGNLTEEYSLLFLSLTFWLTCRFGLDKKNEVKPFHIFIIGICAGFLVWIRLNNLGALCACVVFIFVVIIKNKNWKGLFSLFLFFILGLLTVSLPVIIYFLYHGALYDMLFASFLYNFKYIGINESEDSLRDHVALFFYILKAWMPFIVLTVGTVLHYLKKRDYKILLLSVLLLIFGYISTHVGAAYYHYMTLNIPCLVLGCIYICEAFQKHHLASRIICIALSISLIVFSAYKSHRNGILGEGDSYYISQARNLVAEIPKDERNSIFAYQTMTRFHTSADVMPYFRNFMMQEWQGKYNKQIITDINNMVTNNPPKWIFTQFRAQSTNAEFWKIVDEKYVLFDKNEVFELYRLKDNYRKAN